MEKKNYYRVPGEFEPQNSVLTVWPADRYPAKGMDTDKVSAEMVAHLIGHVDVVVVCRNKKILSRAQKSLSEYGCNLSAINFHTHAIDSEFPRDFGMEVIVDENGHKKFIDFRFVEYAFLPNDLSFSFGAGMRDFSHYHADLSGITESVPTWIASEGGDREFNGRGVMIAIEQTEVTSRNPGRSREEVEEEFKHALNLEKVIWIPQGTYDDDNVIAGQIPDANGTTVYRSATANGHIDEMCRFVNEDTVLLAGISEEEAKHSELASRNKIRLDQAYHVLSQATDANGKPLRIVRMPMPEPIYCEVRPGEYVWESIKYFTDANEGTFLDGSPMPENPITVLPALSYCNFLITNGLVISQKYWREGMSETIRRKDEQAQTILRELFPDRRIVAIDTLALNIRGGGIHCHTRNIPK